MKKKLLVVLACMLLVFSCVACGKEENKEKETKVKNDVAVADIMSKISSEANVVDFKTSVDKGQLEYLYLDLDMSLVEDAAGLMIEDSKADEITVIKAVDGKAAEIKKAFEARVESQKEISKQYDMEQYERLNNADNYVIKTLGNYVILSISTDNDKVVKAFEAAVTE